MPADLRYAAAMRMLRPAALALSLLLAIPAARADAIRLFIGTFSTRGSEGIYAATLDPDTGVLSGAAPVARAINPNWVAWHPRLPVLYSAEDAINDAGARAGSIAAYAVAADGSLTLLRRQWTGMGGSCHLAADPAGRLLVTADYSAGAVLAFPLDADGAPGPLAQVARHAGSGPSAKRQEAPHAHGVTFAPGAPFVFIPDLGIDRVVGYRITGGATPIEAVLAATAKLPAGAGPRHLAFHPNGRWAYVINELDATVSQFDWDARAGTLTRAQTVRTLREDPPAPNTSAEIIVHPSGRWIYASNRGDDSIAVLKVDATTGAPALVQNVPAGGRTPRGMALDPAGRFLLVASQDEDRIAVLRVDADTGRLEMTDHRAAVPSPVCIAFPPRAARK